MSFILLGILNSQAAAVAGAVAGYVAGGFETSRLTTVDKFAFPDDTRTTLATGLSAARSQAAGFSNASVGGYVAGGFVGSAADTVDKFTFPDDKEAHWEQVCQQQEGCLRHFQILELLAM